jgi:hypothetical protein
LDEPRTVQMGDCRVLSKKSDCMTAECCQKRVTAEDPNLGSPGPAALRKINYGYN